MARTCNPRTRPALLSAAGDLFYERGVAATALDDVADASGLTKPTLYRHFASKDALVAAYLDQRHVELDAELRAFVGSVPPEERPWAVIEWLCRWLASPSFNGCAFVRAYAELHRDAGVAERARRRKQVLLETITDACRAAGAVDPVELAGQLALIVEGATTMAFVSDDPAMATAAARRLAQTALEAASMTIPASAATRPPRRAGQDRKESGA